MYTCQLFRRLFLNVQIISSKRYSKTLDVETIRPNNLVLILFPKVFIFTMDKNPARFCHIKVVDKHQNNEICRTDKSLKCYLRFVHEVFIQLFVAFYAQFSSAEQHIIFILFLFSFQSGSERRNLISINLRNG